MYFRINIVVPDAASKRVSIKSFCNGAEASSTSSKKQ
jgi:hypothetical protein